MDLRQKINVQLKECLKDKNQAGVSTIRLIMAALKDRDIAARAQGKADGIDENEILSLLQSMIKQREESAKLYDDGGRPELAARERLEISIIQEFLPQQLSEDELCDVVHKFIADNQLDNIKDMGRVMGMLKKDYAGKVDMTKASDIVKKALS